MSAHVISLKKGKPAGMVGLDNKPTYHVLVNGQPTNHTLFFNTRGYSGYLPLPDGSALDIGERGITAFEKEIKKLNREFARKSA